MKLSIILIVLCMISCIILVCFLPEINIEQPAHQRICFSGTVSEHDTDNERKVLVHVVDPGNLYILTDATDVFVVLPETYTTLPRLEEKISFVCFHTVDQTDPPVLYAKSVSIK